MPSLDDHLAKIEIDFCCTPAKNQLVIAHFVILQLFVINKLLRNKITKLQSDQWMYRLWEMELEFDSNNQMHCNAAVTMSLFRQESRTRPAVWEEVQDISS